MTFILKGYIYIYIYIQEMAEERKDDKYIRCSKCRSKYINDEEHISKSFGYTRLEERYNTCVKCRGNKVKCKTYYDKNKDVLNEHNKNILRRT